LLGPLFLSNEARAEERTRRSTDPAGLWGGSTLGAGNAVWLRPSAGYDFQAALLAFELGYARAVIPQLDASASVSLSIGFTKAVTGTLRARWGAFRWRNFHLAGDFPASVSYYTAGDPPRLTMFGTEPGVAMSTTVGRTFAVFYGVALRYYHAETTNFFGPQARAGAGWALGGFRLAFGTNLSRVLVTKTPAMTLFAADLSVAYLFGGS
jgi:hypothetical protein